jgi:gluconate 2-dehydrogenase gamma chain
MVTDAQLRALEAAAKRILPSGEGPGAAETGAAEVCKRAIRDDHFRAVRPHVLAGLDELQAAARQRFGRDFPDCPPTQQDELLRSIERSGTWRSKLFFAFLIHHTLEGFLGEPAHGGNQDGLGWMFIGMEASYLRSGLCVGERRR